MKAAVYYETGPPEVLRYEDVADPVVYPGGVLIEVEAISIEGGDTLNRAGGEMPAVPHVVGYQCAGTIREVGEGVTDRHVGQRVVATNLWGSHAELTVVPAIITWPVPDGADMVSAACVPVAFGTADDCLFEFGHLQAGETVLIQAGAGRRRDRRDPAREARAGNGHRDRVERRPTRSAEGLRARPRGRLRARRLGRQGPRDHRRSRRQSRRRLGRRAHPRRAASRASPTGDGASASGARAAIRSRSTSSVLGMNNQSLTGVFLGAEITTPRAQAMITRLIDDVAAGPPAGRDRPHLSRSRKPPRPTRTSRAAKP